MEGQYLGPVAIFFPEYIAEEERFFKIISWVSVFVLKAKQGSFFGLKFLVLYDRGFGFLSPKSFYP